MWTSVSGGFEHMLGGFGVQIRRGQAQGGATQTCAACGHVAFLVSFRAPVDVKVSRMTASKRNVSSKRLLRRRPRGDPGAEGAFGRAAGLLITARKPVCTARTLIGIGGAAGDDVPAGAGRLGDK